MTLISKYTTRILGEVVNFKFDNRESSDLSKAIGQHLADFQDELKQRQSINTPLRKLRNLNNVI